jgi:hypothetical protein
MLGTIPGLLTNPAVLRHFKWWMGKCHCLMTNVPGPKVPLTMAGQEITSYIVRHSPPHGTHDTRTHTHTHTPIVTDG